MPAFAASAPGKVILFGEHAVVYDRPAIAVPVNQVQAKVSVSANPMGPQGQVWISAKDVGLNSALSDLPTEHPFAVTVQRVLDELHLQRIPALRLTISSTIPIAAGLGSGAAVTVAMTRALAAFLGRQLTTEQVSAIAYRVDQYYHGTPSGIDNTVIAYAQPVWFQRSQGFQPLQVAQPFTLVIGNTGIASPTGSVVADVRRQAEAAPKTYQKHFDDIAQLTLQARHKIEHGPIDDLGTFMNANHALLQAMTVSSPELDQLVQAAQKAGAAGAKLCGGGRGGNMIALVEPAQAAAVAAALQAAGAVRTLITTVPAG